MRDISIFYDGRGYTFSWIKVMLWAKKSFEELGYKVHFDNLQEFFPKGNRIKKLKDGAKRSHDIVFLAYHHGHTFCDIDFEYQISILKEFKKHSNLVCWMDTADSTGTAMFEFMPYVDLYFKKQWLKDKSRYFEPIWGGRTFAEYYHTKYQLSNEGIEKEYFEVLKPEYLEKCRLSWNVGLGDINANTDHLSQKYIFYNEMRDFDYSDVFHNKKYDTHFRGSAYPSSVGYQRFLTKKKLEIMENIVLPENWESKVSKKTYIEELKSAKTLISPFGWGEICTRDFEAFAYGCVLLKPSMEHCETFPNWYINGETYFSLDWNLIDAEEKIRWLLSDNEIRNRVAKNAQEVLMKYRNTDFGKNELAKHIIGEIER